MYSSEDEMNCQEIIIIVGLLLIVSHNRVTDGCHGPGVPPKRRKPSRLLTPLVLKQHIPNISEFTIGASGPPEGRITREDKRFKDLIVNYNPQVVFKNEEGTDDDRRMSKRCKDRVDTLAYLVSARWPAVKLRVTEAWEPHITHPEGSLHYEGRAVDLTTDDRDHSKYGMLARLAVEAGFDWVYYDSKYHVHASVIADDSETTLYGSGCFSGESTVTMENGESRKMSELEVGDRVLATDRSTGSMIPSDIILMMHKSEDDIADFLTISVTSSLLESRTHRQITLTQNHLIFVHSSNPYKRARWRPRAVYASEVKEGDVVYMKSLLRGNITEATLANVTRVKKVKRSGVYAPLTDAGTVVVDGVVASCYAVFDNEPISHALFLPLRTLWRLGARWSSSVYGIHWYPKTIFNAANAVLPSGVLRP
ncbi:desert hedgehog protein A-like [Styela clava]